MNSRSAIRVLGVWAICTCTPMEAIQCCGSSIVLATSGFNDALGIHANPAPNSPFQIGVTVDLQGVGESGWDTPWQRLGGFEDRAPVSSEFVYEGDGAVKLFADNVFGTAFERAWFEIVPVVRIDAYVLVRPTASMRGNAVHTTMGGEIPARTSASWEISSNGDIRVFPTSLNNSISTGFSTLPNQWNKYSLVLNSSTQTWNFLFNDQLFHSAQPLTYLNPTNFIDRVNLQAQGTLTTYVDAVTVSVVPVDYEKNGTINAGDFSFWKAHFGDTSGIGLQADGSGNGITDAADYVLWRDNFTGVVGARAVIPEPPSLVLAAAILLVSKRNKRVRTNLSK